MKTSEDINELATALAAAQAIMKPAIKSKINPHFKNKYADLDDIWDACREPLGKNGLSVIQTPSFFDGRIIITTRLCHKSGQWVEDQLSLRPMKDDPQGAGACITYGRRQMMGIIGATSDEDEDGNNASTPKPKVNEFNPLDSHAIFIGHSKQTQFVSDFVKQRGGTKEELGGFCKDFFEKKLTMEQVYSHLKEAFSDENNR